MCARCAARRLPRRKITAASLARNEKSFLGVRNRQGRRNDQIASLVAVQWVEIQPRDSCALPDARPEIIDFPRLRREIRQRVERRSRRKARLPIRAEVMFSR